MVFSFFRGGDEALDQIEKQVSSMLSDCRHSFDLAMGALVSDADITPVGEEIRATDRRINETEETVRRELVVHVSVQGGTDVALVLTYLLIVKKLERVGDQAKNIFDLADEGVRFSDAPDYPQFMEFRNEVSGLFGAASAILSAQDEKASHDYVRSAETLMDRCDGLVNGLIHADDPASFAVPRAMLFRYLKRIVANLASVVGTVVQPIDRSNPGDSDLDD